MSERCTITITMHDDAREGQYQHSYSEEDLVKHLWGYMVPWFTRRHGVENGKIALNGGSVEVEWRYENLTEDEADRADAEVALADFEENGGTSLEDLKKELRSAGSGPMAE